MSRKSSDSLIYTMLVKLYLEYTMNSEYCLNEKRGKTRG